ncbi:hypothetical protein Hdeb2414_s0014g00429411 [Helianthus debilis subsp. tardiflorus]
MIIMCLASGLDYLHNDFDNKKWSNNRDIKSFNICLHMNERFLIGHKLVHVLDEKQNYVSCNSMEEIHFVADDDDPIIIKPRI